MMRKKRYKFYSGRYDDLPLNAPKATQVHNLAPEPTKVEPLRRTGSDTVPLVVPVKVMDSFYSTLPPKEVTYFFYDTGELAQAALISTTPVTFARIPVNEGEILDIDFIRMGAFIIDESRVRHEIPKYGLVDLFGLIRINGASSQLNWTNVTAPDAETAGNSFSELNVNILEDRYPKAEPVHIVVQENLTFELQVRWGTGLIQPFGTSWVFRLQVGCRRFPKQVWEDSIRYT